MGYLLGCLVALLGGAALSLQIVLNVQLRQGLGSPAIAAFVSFAVGALVCLIFALAARVPWPTGEAAARLPAYAWLGGALGAFYVGSTIVLGPRLGSGVFVVLVIAGQVVSALTIDQLGWLGGAHVMTPLRLAGAVLVVLGAFLIQRS